MKKLSYIIISILITALLQTAVAGDSDRTKGNEGVLVKAVIINKDTVPVVNLREAVIASRRIFTSADDAKKFRLLVRDVRRVYPYAIILSAKVKEYDRQMLNMSRKDKKTFMKKIEPEFKAQFEKVFRNNTVNQAQILIKLINRQTGSDSHFLIKQFKGAWNAFMWQSIAMVVGTNLKEMYDPEGSDSTIEQIVLDIEAGAI